MQPDSIARADANLYESFRALAARIEGGEVREKDGLLIAAWGAPVAAFKAKRRKSHLVVTEFIGDPKALAIVKAFGEANEVRVTEESSQIPDSEVMEWYEKMYGRGAAK